MKDHLAKLLDAQALLKIGMAPLLEAIKNTTLPLDERWDVYTQLVENDLLVRETTNADGLLGEFFGRNRVSLYDDFYMDRGQSRTFPEIWTKIIVDEDEMDAYRDPAKRDAWRERVLASGYSGFEYDW